MGKTTSFRWRSVASILAMLFALVVVPRAASAHPGEHNQRAEGEGIGVDVAIGGVTTFFPAFQWAGTPAVSDETAELVYAGSGCTPANYLVDDFEGKIALVDDAAPSEDPTESCPVATFFQKVQSAERAGAIGFVQVPIEMGRANATAIVADIPALELKERSPEAVAVLDVVKAGEAVTATLTDRTEPIPSMGPTACEGGTAGPFACDGVDLLSLTAADTFNSAGISDLWGWTDAPGDDNPDGTGGEYVIVGKTNGVAFFRITEPTAPEYLGELDNPGLIHAVWHDIKVHDNHAFIVSESENHGMTVFDLTRLRDATPAPAGAEATEWTPDARYNLTSAAHNLEINEEIGMAYILGGNAGIVAPDHCLSGLHMVDINDPKNPTFAGCYLEEGGPGTAARAAGSPVTDLSPAAYVHDTQCVVYEGPDEEHRGKNICVTAAENKIVVADVTNPVLPETLGTTEYPHVAYAHQGWFDESQTYWFVNDELAQMTFPDEAPNTRTIVIDLTDLDNPTHHFDYFPRGAEGGMTAITHNNYVVGDRLYQSNYASGLRVADISGVATKEMEEIAFFDTYPTDDDTNFDGTWSNYPFFESGTIAVSGRAEGLFLLELADEGDELGVDVACVDCPVEIRAGESGSARIGLGNSGDVADAYTVTADGLPEGWTATADPDSVALRAGEDGGTDLTITVPRRSQAGSYTFTVTATSERDSSVSDSRDVAVDVVKGKPSPGRPATAGGSGSDTSSATAAGPGSGTSATSAGSSLDAVPASATRTSGGSTGSVALLVGLALALLIPPVVRRRLGR